MLAAPFVQSSGFSSEAGALLPIRRGGSARRVPQSLCGGPGENRRPPSYASLLQRCIRRTTAARNSCPAELLVSAGREEPLEPALSQFRGFSAGQAPRHSRLFFLAAAAYSTE